MTIAIIAAIGIGIALFIAAYIWVTANRQNRTDHLKGRFGPEYDYERSRLGSRQRAEAELAEREKRVGKLDIRPLPETQRQEFAQRWRDVQARFVDDPQNAVMDADQLVDQVMTARGYPVGEFDQRVSDVSVDHPQVIAHYRAAYGISHSNGANEGDTELLRQAMVHYRALFDDLLMPEPVAAR
jgi:hypothetical protein